MLKFFGVVRVKDFENKSIQFKTTRQDILSDSTDEFMKLYDKLKHTRGVNTYPELEKYQAYGVVDSVTFELTSDIDDTSFIYGVVLPKLYDYLLKEYHVIEIIWKFFDKKSSTWYTIKEESGDFILLCAPCLNADEESICEAWFKEYFYTVIKKIKQQYSKGLSVEEAMALLEINDEEAV